MLRDVILVPTFARPEYLSLCLESICEAEGSAEKEIWISHDRHLRDQRDMAREVELARAVAARYSRLHGRVMWIERRPHPFAGNSYNVLELYKAAYLRRDVRYVFLVEDDVLVGSDFFRWHEAIQQRGDYFASVGWHCARDGVSVNDSPCEYVESARDYASIGVCWRRENLGGLVRHARVEYYRSPCRYVAQVFANSPIPIQQWTEQDGIVMRLLREREDRWVAWPTLRRCSHVGVRGYHRPNGQRFSGELSERVRELRAAVEGEGIVAMNHDFHGDVQPRPEVRPWTPDALRLVQRILGDA